MGPQADLDGGGVAALGSDVPSGGASRSRASALRHVDVHVAPGHGNKSLATRYAAASVTRDVAVIVPTFTAAAAIVAETDLVASLPASLLGVLRPRLALRRISTPLPPLAMTINLLRYERTHEDPAAAAGRGDRLWLTPVGAGAANSDDKSAKT